MGLEQYKQENLGEINSKILEDVNKVINFNNTFNALNLFNTQSPVKVPYAVDAQNSDNNQNSVNIQNIFKTPSNVNALKSLGNLDEKQLTKYIKESFQNNGTRFKYSHMKQNQYYPFMVQSAIDLLSDKLNDTRYNVDGLLDPEHGKSLDDWIKYAGGINNSYGQETKDVVKIVQKILGLTPVDGLAGPLFFAHVCAILNDEPQPTGSIPVEGYGNNNKYKPIAENNNTLKEMVNEITNVKAVINHIKENPNNKNKDILAINCEGNRIYYGINRGSGSSDADWKYSYSNLENIVDPLDLNSPRSWGKGWESFEYKDVKDAMKIGNNFSLDIKYNQVLAIKQKWISEYHGKWPPEDEDDVFKTWTDQCIKQKKDLNRKHKKNLAKWCIKKKDGRMGQDFLERGEKMTRIGLPADKITIKTRLTLRDVKNISQIVSG